MKSIILSPKALEDIAFWKKSNPATVVKITSLLVDIASNPFSALVNQNHLNTS